MNFQDQRLFETEVIKENVVFKISAILILWCYYIIKKLYSFFSCYFLTLMFFLNCMLSILRYEKISCDTDESIASCHDPSIGVILLGVYSESFFFFMEYFLSRKLCSSQSQSVQIHLVNLLWISSGKLFLPLEQYIHYHLMNFI